MDNLGTDGSVWSRYELTYDDDVRLIRRENIAKPLEEKLNNFIIEYPYDCA
jgi:hypothetical protein